MPCESWVFPVWTTETGTIPGPMWVLGTVMSNPSGGSFFLPGIISLHTCTLSTQGRPSAKLEFSLCNPFSSVLCTMNSSHYDLPRLSAHSLQLRESTVGVEKFYLYPSKFFDWSNHQTDIRQRKTNKSLTACNVLYVTRPKLPSSWYSEGDTLPNGDFPYTCKYLS